MFKVTWERAQRALTGLSGARKLALGALVALMATSAVWLSQQTARGRMEPVLDQTFADADVVIIGEHLRGKQIPYELRDGHVYVPAERKMDVLSELIYANALSGSTESGFDAMIRKSNVFDTPSKTDKMFNHAREVTLQSVIRNFRGVRKATVIIDPTNERHIGGSITPSALVDIQTRPGGEANPRQLASAAVNAVTGAVSTMERAKVKVTIDGASYNVAGETFDGDVLERRQQCEQAYVQKVRQILSFIPDVLVSVSVDLNVQSVEEEKRIVDPENYLHKETRVETRTEQNPLEVPAESEVLANAVPQIPEKLSSASAPAARSENTTSEYSLLTSETVQKSRTPAGKETVLSASVAVPRSYLVQVYKRGIRDARQAQEPDDALLQPIVNAQLATVRRLVRNALGLKNDSDVTVEVYDDATATPAPTVVASTEAAVIPPVAVLRGYTKEIAWAGAGMVGLVALTMMLRRGGAPAASHEFISDANAAAQVAVLEAPRLKPRAWRHAQSEDDDLLRQVRELAARQPQDAARVLREWIDQE